MCGYRGFCRNCYHCYRGSVSNSLAHIPCIIAHPSAAQNSVGCSATGVVSIGFTAGCPLIIADRALLSACASRSISACRMACVCGLHASHQSLGDYFSASNELSQTADRKSRHSQQLLDEQHHATGANSSCRGSAGATFATGEPCITYCC